VFIIGRGRYARAAYPERSPQAAQPLGAFAFYQSDNFFTQVAGDPPLQIATATINVAPGSRIKVEAVAVVIGTVAPGIALLFSPEILIVVVSQSFDTPVGANNRTLNYLGVTDPQPGGPVTVNIDITVSVSGGPPGASVSNAGVTVLTLTEIPAASGP
jgi:hypothetical protein